MLLLLSEDITHHHQPPQVSSGVSRLEGLDLSWSLRFCRPPGKQAWGACKAPWRSLLPGIIPWQWCPPGPFHLTGRKPEAWPSTPPLGRTASNPGSDWHPIQQLSTLPAPTLPKPEDTQRNETQPEPALGPPRSAADSPSGFLSRGSCSSMPRGRAGKDLTPWKRPWCWERLKAGGERDDRGWVGWMALLTRQTWVWASSGSRWWTGKLGVLQSMGSQRIRPEWLNWTELNRILCLP